MREEPSRFVSHVQRAVELVRAHAFFAGAHEIERHQPHIQLDVAGLHDRAGHDGEVFAALFRAAAVAARALRGVVAADRSALAADTLPARPAKRFDVAAGLGIILKMGGVEFHGPNLVIQACGVKYISRKKSLIIGKNLSYSAWRPVR